MASHMDFFMKGGHPNKKLRNEKEKYFVMLSVINADYYKKRKIKKTQDIERPWIIHETIVMYALRELDIELYNGDEDGKDNAKRSFLINNNTLAVGERRTTTLNYLNDEAKGVSEDWDDLIDKVKDELINSLFNQLNVYDGESIRKLNLEEWQNRKEELSKDEWIAAKSEKGIKTICNKLRQKKLTKEDLSSLGIKPISVEGIKTLVDQGYFDRIIFHKFGNYIGESPLKILKIKLNDLKDVTYNSFQFLSEKKPDDLKICLWSLQRLPVELTREFLSENNRNKQSRYIVLMYTPSKGDSSKKDKDDCHPSGYYSVKELKDNKINTNFPKSMTPLVIRKFSGNDRKESSVALILSEINYIVADYPEIKSIYQYYDPIRKGQLHDGNINSNFNKGNEKSFARNTLNASMKEGQKDALIDFLMNKPTKNTDFTSFLIARLEYPYIITLVN